MFASIDAVAKTLGFLSAVGLLLDASFPASAVANLRKEFGDSQSDVFSRRCCSGEFMDR